MSDDKLILCFMPSLVALLLAKEKEKGTPLTEEEVVAIRDGATVVAIPKETLPAIEERRGYADIDPEKCWSEWQRLRAELNSA